MLPTYSSYTARCLIWRFWLASVWCASPVRTSAGTSTTTITTTTTACPTHPSHLIQRYWSSPPFPLFSLSGTPSFPFLPSVPFLSPFTVRLSCAVCALFLLCAPYPAHSPHFSFLFYFSSTLSPPLHRPTAFRLPFFSFFFFLLLLFC